MILHIPVLTIDLTVIAPTNDAMNTTNALYNFRLLSALRSDDPSAVQPFLDDLQNGDEAEKDRKAGRLLGMAVRIASGRSLAFYVLSPAIRILTGRANYPTNRNLGSSDRSQRACLFKLVGYCLARCQRNRSGGCR